MKTINEIQDYEQVYDELNDEQIYACDLKSEWNSLSIDERNNFRSTKERIIKLSAESVLDWIYDSMEDDGYEEMSIHLWNDTTDEFKQRFQALLDEISSFPSAKVYDSDDYISSFVDLEEE